jgi:hypothetical protein
MYKILRVADKSFMRASNSVCKEKCSQHFKNENIFFMFRWGAIKIIIVHIMFLLVFHS